ncbi:MAG: Flp pilus assembly complex ATPase component TadA [Bradymonadaceae bacterium]|nr:Flp pilus assembly complex ATPase component TadA [Lujinxingiaceae bacterium]
MTFQEASEFLNTPHSTLYRWLREGHVPAHKLGRQWRFLRQELEEFRAQGPTNKAAADLKALAELLRTRNLEESEMDHLSTSPAQLATNLIWDALDHGASVIHFQPVVAGHEIRYRTRDGLERLTELSPSAFESLDRQWQERSQALRSPSSRRLILERELEADEPSEACHRVHVRYQKLETTAGDRLTLRLRPESRFAVDLAAITRDEGELETLRRWAHAPKGLVIFAGKSGSGKTTTAYASLMETAQSGERVVFSIEDQTAFLLEGVNQIEIDLDDARQYRETFNAIFESDLDVLFISSTFAQRHLELLWGTALNTAESGHLVFLQVEADSAADALARVQAAVSRPIADQVVGICWQELRNDEAGKRYAAYEFLESGRDQQ